MKDFLRRNKLTRATMTKEKYNQIIDKAYNDYCDSFNDSIIAPNTKEVFIDKCKHSIEYSVRWGLKIEERTVFEQVDQNNPVLKGSTALYSQKLITVTYNNKTIEIYDID
jgi:hypothetical protein